MLSPDNEKMLVEIALDRETAPSTRVSACTLIHRISLLPASEIIGILQDTINDYRCKDGIAIKALDLMDKVDSSRSNEKSISPDSREAVEQQIMAEYLGNVTTDTSTGKVQEQDKLP